ncbi:hypothetical protein [Proteiniborus sp.]
MTTAVSTFATDNGTYAHEPDPGGGITGMHLMAELGILIIGIA